MFFLFFYFLTFNKLVLGNIMWSTGMLVAESVPLYTYTDGPLKRRCDS